MRAILWMLVLFPFIEITLLAILIGHFGLGLVLFYLLLSALIGFWMLHNKKLGALLVLASVMRQGERVSIYSLLWPLRYLLAGVLLIIPGIVSEIIAVLLLLPFKSSQMPLNETGSTNPTADDIIEGEFHRVDPVEAEPKQIELPRH